ncbi:CheY-like chemotaxis protein [Sphingomonas sp. F9_3S_D5_B_2]
MSGAPSSNTVLVLEDEPIIAFTLEDMLLELGYQEVILSGDVRGALALLETCAPCAAVLDVNIRGERSYPVAAVLAERRVPFIFATGYGDAQHPEELRSVPTVTKPYTAEAIRSALAAA